GCLRNVAVALGNSRDPAAVPVRVKALEHEEPLVRAHAAWALGRLGGREALERRRPTETEAEVLEEIDAALAELEEKKGTPRNRRTGPRGPITRHPPTPQSP